MSHDPTQPIKKAASTGARTVKPGRLRQGLTKLLPLSLRTRIKLLVARLWTRLKAWRLRRRARNV
jgi:hypothetical protein